MRTLVAIALVLILAANMAHAQNRTIGEWLWSWAQGAKEAAKLGYKALTVIATIAAIVIMGLRLLFGSPLSMVFLSGIMISAVILWILPLIFSWLAGSGTEISSLAEWIRANIVVYPWE